MVKNNKFNSIGLLWAVSGGPSIWKVPVVKGESCGDIDGGGASLVPGRRCQSYLRPSCAPRVAFNKQGHTPRSPESQNYKIQGFNQ